MKVKMTEPQERLLNKLPEIFVLEIDYRVQNCPPIIKDESGNVVYQLGKGDIRCLISLLRNGILESGGILDKSNDGSFDILLKELISKR